ncbi:hypothetical protein [Deinococcus sp.]|uniref:hypothetical protein n=1 Tax=Deinococcus sp. TaxID=47478 RepID=UPI002869D832|nr:hypothetical protein [Deinococcus sp.]
MTASTGWILSGQLAALGGADITLFGRLNLDGVPATLATTLRALIMAAVMFAVALSSGWIWPLLRAATTSRAARGGSCCSPGSAVRARGPHTSPR